MPQYLGELRGALRTHKFTPFLDVTQVLLRDTELGGKLDLRHFLSLAHRLDQPAERQLPDQAFQELHSIAFLLSTHGDLPLNHLKCWGQHLVHALSCPVPLGYAGPDFFAFGLDFIQEFLFVEPEILPTVYQNLSIDNHRADVPADGGFHHGLDRIAHGAEGNILEIDDCDVRLGSLLQPA